MYTFKISLSIKKTLDLVHPIFNPKKGWSDDLLYYFNQFKEPIRNEFEIQLVLVNDGSSKGVASVDIESLQNQIENLTYIALPVNQGKGAALRKAMESCHSDLIIYTDFDYPYQLQNMWDMLHKLNEQKSDIVVGVRDEQYYDELPWQRMIFSLSLKVMNYLFFPRLKVKDTQSGLKGFNQKGKELFMKTKIAAFLFDMEFLVLASKNQDITVDWIYLQVREGVQFSGMKFKTVLIELVNFLSIWKRAI